MTSSLNQLIKKLAIEAVEQSVPCTVIIGEVAKASPLKIKINNKVTIDSDFFYLTKTAKDAVLKKGDKVVVIRSSGGQKYTILDKVVND